MAIIELFMVSKAEPATKSKRDFRFAATENLSKYLNAEFGKFIKLNTSLHLVDISDFITIYRDLIIINFDIKNVTTSAERLVYKFAW